VQNLALPVANLRVNTKTTNQRAADLTRLRIAEILQRQMMAEASKTLVPSQASIVQKIFHSDLDQSESNDLRSELSDGARSLPNRRLFFMSQLAAGKRMKAKVNNNREAATTVTFGTLFALLGIGALLLSGCSLYSNDDRQSFNARAVPQTQTAAVTTTSSCALQFDHVIAFLCDEDATTTIVRVLR
jgi:hypothetical protein